LRRDSFAPLCERAKIEGLTIHGLRRSAATLLVQQGVDVVTVARMLGETRPATALQHYVFTSPDQQRRAVAALDSALRAPRRRAP
jgi:integrase